MTVLQHLNALAERGLDYAAFAGHLEAEGLAEFAATWSELLATVADQLKSPPITGSKA
jgi:hypothetical protein